MKAVYILSDLHLGAPDKKRSLEREKIIVSFLDEIKNDAEEIILLGDIFDYWFEFKSVVPKGFVRFLGKLAELSDQGIKISVFSGNHDIWYGDLFPEELNIPVFTEPKIRNIYGYNFFLAHGDGLGPGDYGYKLLKKFLRSKLAKFLIRWIHPEIGIPLALMFSKTSRLYNENYREEFLGENEFLYKFVVKHSSENPQIDYYVFGHRHIAMDIPVNKTKIFYIGDWIFNYSYLKIDETGPKLLFYNNDNIRTRE